MQNNLSPRGRRLSSFVLYSILPALAALLLFVSPTGRTSNPPPAAETAAEAEPAFQIPRPWTAVGSTGAIDELSLNRYAFNNAEVGFRPGAAGNTVVVRYNVTNTFDNNGNPNRPGWTTLEMGSVAPVNTIIEARLFEIQSCTQVPQPVCTAHNRSMDNPCARCTFPPTRIDFTGNLYFVEVTLTRPVNSQLMPRMQTLRIF